MDEGEILIFIIAIILGGVGAGSTSTCWYHRLFFRRNSGVGLVKLSVWAAMAWIAFVIWRYADPSVVGIYVVFYLVMGYAVVKVFGQLTGGLFGPRFRVDICERKNLPAALVLAAFVLATGLIFGGSLWGEADPVGDDEGGWWIPLTFFLLGWSALATTLGLFFWREPGRVAVRLRQDRALPDARAATAYSLGAAWILTEAVAGDFYGWWHGLLTFGVIAGMLLAHELFRSVLPSPGGADPSLPVPPLRWLESGFYILCGFAVWGANRFLDRILGPGL